MEYDMNEDLRWMLRREGKISNANKNILITKKYKDKFYDERKETTYKIYDSLGRLIVSENKVYVIGSDKDVDHMFKETVSFTNIFGFIKKIETSEYEDAKLLWQKFNDFEYKLDAINKALVVSEIVTHNRYIYDENNESYTIREIDRFETVVYLKERKVIKKDYKTGRELKIQKYDETGKIIYSKDTVRDIEIIIENLNKK